jgi:hypothetical protein
MMVRSTVSLVVILLACSAMAADALRSGPPVGAENDRDGFRPQWVTGPAAGQRLCPV